MGFNSGFKGLKNLVPQFLHSILSTFHSPRNGNEKCTENTHYFGRKAPLTGHKNEMKDSVCVADTTLGWILLRIWYVWLQKPKVLPYSQRTTMGTEGRRKLRWKIHRNVRFCRKGFAKPITLLKVRKMCYLRCTVNTDTQNHRAHREGRRHSN